MAVDFCRVYMLMLVLTTLALVEGHNGLAEGKQSTLNYLDN